MADDTMTDWKVRAEKAEAQLASPVVGEVEEAAAAADRRAEHFARNLADNRWNPTRAQAEDARNILRKCRDLLRRFGRVPKLETWQLMDNAPRDGTKILATNRLWKFNPVRLMYRHDPGGRYESWVEVNGSTIWPDGPTHWMALPDALAHMEGRTGNATEVEK